MHPVKFSWCFFPPIAGNASIVRVRESGVGLGFRIAGTSVGPTRLEPLLGIFLSPVSSGTPLVHRSCRRADGVRGWRVVDLDAARRRRAASSGDGRLPAAAAAPDAARSAQPSITPPAARRTVRVDLYVESTTPTTSRDTSKSPNSPPRECLRLGKLYIQGLAIWTR